MKYLYTIVILGCLAACCYQNRSTAEEAAPATSAGPLEPTAQFDREIARLREQLDKDAVPPTPVEAMLWRRIKAHGEITQQALDAAVNAWRGYEGRTVMRAVDPVTAFSQTKRLIGELLPVFKDNPWFTASLLKKRAEILWSEEDRAAAHQDFAAAAKLMEPVHIAVDILRMQCLVGTGDTAYLTGDKPAADRAYLQALSYDWYKVRDAEGQRALRELYLTAGRGIIEVRRRDKAALKDLFFVPSTYGELGPLLDEALAEAEKRP